jgi:hypothetical protein
MHPSPTRVPPHVRRWRGSRRCPGIGDGGGGGGEGIR